MSSLGNKNDQTFWIVYGHKCSVKNNTIKSWVHFLQRPERSLGGEKKEKRFFNEKTWSSWGQDGVILFAAAVFYNDWHSCWNAVYQYVKIQMRPSNQLARVWRTCPPLLFPLGLLLIFIQGLSFCNLKTLRSSPDLFMVILRSHCNLSASFQ